MIDSQLGRARVTELGINHLLATFGIIVGLALIVAACDEMGSSSSEESTSIEEHERSSDTPPVLRPGLGGRPDGIRFDVKQWRTDFTNRTVTLDEFWQAVPLKDGIPSLDEPAFVSIEEAAESVEALEPVIEVELAGEARAYPLQIMIWHEIANDVVGGVPIVVTFCPLCSTAVAFERTLAGRVYEFGVSGNLRNSDLVMYDRTTESWWQQYNGEAVVGALAGTALTQVPAAIVSLEDFSARHPAGRVLSIETGYDRRYGLNPYPGYDRVDRPVTRVHANADDDRLLPRARVVLLRGAGETVAIPFSALEERAHRARAGR